MSVVYALNSNYSTIKLGVDTTESVKAPKHIVDTIELTKNINGSLNVPANIETTQINAPIAVLDTVNSEILIPKAGEGGDITVLGNIDLSDNGLKNVSTLTLSTGSGVSGQVIALNGDGELYWKTDAVGTIPTLAQVLTESNDAEGNSILNVESLTARTIELGNTTQIGTLFLSNGESPSTFPVALSGNYGGYINVNNISSYTGDLILSSELGSSIKTVRNLDLSQNDIVNADSITSTFVKTDILDCANPSGTQINVVKNLSLSSNTLYAYEINAGNTITALTTRFGVEANRWTGADSYTLKQEDGDNRVVSDSGADLVGWHDVQSKRGKFYATNASDIEKFSATGDGDVSCVSVFTSKLNIPSQIPSVGQVLGVSSTDGTLQWLDNTVYTPSLSQVLDVSNNAGNNNINMNQKNIQNVNRIYTAGIWNNSVSQDIVVRLEGTGRVLQMSNGDFDLANNNILGGNNASIESINTNNITERSLGSNININSKVDMKTNNISNAGMVSCAQLRPTYKQERTLWVSANNTDVSQNGSFESPFNTPQKAIDFAQSLYDNTYWYINILAGSYSGFTVSKKMFIKGCGPSNPDGSTVGCSITSDITIAMDSNDGDMQNNIISFSSLLIAGCKIVNNSTARHVLNITDCTLYSSSGTGRLIDCRPSSTDCRLQIYNSKLLNDSSSAGDPLIEMGVGMAKFGQSLFQCAGVQNVVKFSGTSRVDSIVLCSFTSTNSSGSLPAIIEITSTTASGFTFANNSFIYTSPNTKSNAYSTGIYANASTTTTITILYNSFYLFGTSDPTNHVVNYSSNAPTVYFFSNNAFPTLASRINGNKASMQAVA